MNVRRTEAAPEAYDHVPNVPTMHHTGLVVRNLDRSLAFYQEMFGVGAAGRLDDVLDDGGRHGVPEARYSRAILTFVAGRVELVEYHVPAGGGSRPRGSCDVGSGHLAFQVADLDSTLRTLVARGMQMLGAPLRIERGPSAGVVLAFGQDLDGNRIEFLQLP